MNSVVSEWTNEYLRYQLKNSMQKQNVREWRNINKFLIVNQELGPNKWTNILRDKIMSRSYKPQAINQTGGNIQVTSSCGLPSGDFSGINSASWGGSSKGSSKIYVCLILLMGTKQNVNKRRGKRCKVTR